MRTLVLVDGEHYPPVIAAALKDLTASGAEVVGAVLLGGAEKLPERGLPDIGGVPVEAGEDAIGTLSQALERWAPEEVVDLSDEPVLDYVKRHELVAVSLYAGVPYRGADFRFEPPDRSAQPTKPALAVIGTGKRTGKTAVAAFAARTLVVQGRKPVIVAMGRGGPPEPEVLRGDEIELAPRDLIALADAGRHAASDYIEDAALARVPTVGCRRCGGGLAGGVEFSNVAAGIEIANDLPGDLLILEGSGSAIPPAHADATLLIVPAGIDPGHIEGYMGPYRLLLADLVVVTMCEEPFGSPSELPAVIAHTQARFAQVREGEPAKVIRTVFRPNPTRPVDGARVVVATTAPERAGRSIERHLQTLGCEVVGISHSLSDRKRLRAELEDMGGRPDMLLCEIKAAGIDVASRWALDAGLDVVYMDNVPVGIDGDDPARAVIELAARADEAVR